MEKSIIIVGPLGSGKSKKAEELAKEYGEDEVVFIEPTKPYHEEEFSFGQCRENTKLIVVDEIIFPIQLECFIIGQSNGIVVGRRDCDGVRIHPKFVIVCSALMSSDFLMDESTLRRFDIIRLEE